MCGFTNTTGPVDSRRRIDAIGSERMIALAMLGATPVLVAGFMCALERFISRKDY